MGPFQLVAPAVMRNVTMSKRHKVNVLAITQSVSLSVIPTATRRNPMAYTLATAAEVAKVAKPTVFRWIKTGKITASKTEDGTYRIEPAELHRYLDSVKETPSPATTQQAVPAPVTNANSLPEMIALRSEVEKLKALLEAEKQRAAEIREDRDRWVEQAQRLALPSPETKRNGGWWPFRRSA